MVGDDAKPGVLVLDLNGGQPWGAREQGLLRHLSAPRPTTYVVRHAACKPHGLCQPQSPFRAFVRGRSPPRGSRKVGAAHPFLLSTDAALAFKRALA